MAIDLRAKTYCNLGTIITGSFADDYLQNSGLIKTVGNVTLQGLHTPAVGTQIFFAYEKNGQLTRLPRVLRVLSSFADPYRKTTDISMGCLLTYFDQLKPPPTTFENEVEIDIAIPPVTGTTLATWVCTQLGLAHGTFPLTNTYALNRLTPDGGYIALLNDLLISESYVGYLDETETLRFIDLSGGNTYGPLLSNQEVIDVSAIGVGQLPAASVVVNYNSLRFKEPDNLLTTRNWDQDESYELGEYSIPYTSIVGGIKYEFTYHYTYTNTTKSTTSYDALDRVVKRVEERIQSLGEVNGQWVGAAMTASNGGGQYYATIPITTTTTTTTTYVSNSAAEYPYCNMPRQTTTTTQQPRIAIAGALGITSYLHPLTGDLASIDQSQVVTSRFVEEYDAVIPSPFGQKLNADTNKLEDLIYNTGITKQKSTTWGSVYQTLSGQQALRKSLDNLEEIASSALYSYDWNAAVNNVINNSTALSLLSLGNQIVTNREFGLEKRPALQDRINAANKKQTTSQNKAELSWVYGSSESISYTEFSMPLASDDQIVNGNVVVSDAAAKALRFGRAQNALLLGNRNGMNLQLPPELLPAAPFAPLYFTADGATAQYRANANSWTFDSSGLVCSTDALFWGGITGNNNFWYPTAPNTTALSVSATPAYDPTAAPANTITTPPNFDPTVSDWISTLLPTNEPATFPTSITPPTSAPPYTETITLTPQLKLSFGVQRLNYSLTPQLHTALPTPVRLSETCTSFTGVAENFFGSWVQQVYGWNTELQPYTWAN
jgi:hypothetical protein